jgi:hypothetical protein
MNNKLIEDGRPDVPAGCFGRAPGGICQRGHAGSSPIPNPDAAVSCPPVSDPTDSVCTQHANGVGRSAAHDLRIALHESGHVVVGRALGQEIGGVTIIPSETYGGLTWGPNYFKSGFDGAANDDDVVPDLAKKIGALMPGPGDSRSDVVDIIAHAHVRVVELSAGTASESLLLPDEAPWVAHSDIRQSRALASLICTSESSIDAYLEFGLVQAKALILQHRAAVLAIAEALLIHRTLNSEQIDNIIATAPGRARQADWNAVLENAANFTAGLES